MNNYNISFKNENTKLIFIMAKYKFALPYTVHTSTYIISFFS